MSEKQRPGKKAQEAQEVKKDQGRDWSYIENIRKQNENYIDKLDIPALNAYYDTLYLAIQTATYFDSIGQPAQVNVEDDTITLSLRNAAQQIVTTVASIAPISEQVDAAENAFCANYEDQYNAGDLSFLVDGKDGITDTPPELLPAIEAEIEAYKKEKGLAELPLKDLLFDAETERGEPLLYALIDRAKMSKPGADYINSTGGHRAKNFNFPIDKPNSVIWGMLEENTHGQITYPIKAEPNSSKKEVSILYSIDFDVIESDFPIVKRLTQYDKRVYIAAGALWDAGNNIVTTAQIYHAMGYTGVPGAADKEKIDRAFTKFTARITINNDQEIKAGYTYPRFDYDGDLLPFERVRERDKINGQLTESTIHIFREPPLLSFARGRKQLTTYPLKVLQSPNSKTERNLAIEDYLLERIAKAKSGSEPRKILLTTLYDHANITSRVQKTRAPQTIKNYLDHYKKCEIIKDYTMDKTSILLELGEQPKKKQPKKKKTGK